MPMCSLLEYSDNYADSAGSLYQFKRYESPVNNSVIPINIVMNNVTSFKYKTSLLGICQLI